MMTPARLLMPAHANKSRPVTSIQGMSTFIGPILSAIELGSFAFQIRRSLITRPGRITHYSSKERSGVQQYRQVDCQVLIYPYLFERIDLNVEKWNIEAHETKELGYTKEREWYFSPPGKIDQSSGCRGLHTHCHAQEGDGESGKHDESHYTSRPRKPNPSLKLLEEYGVNNATQTTPTRRETLRQRLFRCEVGWKDGDGRQEKKTASETYGNALCKKYLPVCGAQARHHHAKNDSDAPSEDQSMEVTTIEQRPSEDADKDQ